MESIIANPWVGVIGTLVGIVVSIVIYMRGRQFQRTAYSCSSMKWYDGKSVPHADLKLTFRGKEIPRFTITHMAFWNSGNQVIRKSDFAPASQLRLRIPPDTEVFDIRVTASTAPEIRASVDSPDTFVACPTGDEVPVNFDYLDPNDGFSIQVIHDAASLAEFTFLGKLPGVHEFQGTSRAQNALGPYSPILLSPDNPPMLMWFVIPVMFFGAGAIGVWSIYWAIFREFHWYQIPGGLMVIYFIVPFLIASHPTLPNALHKAMTDSVKRNA